MKLQVLLAGATVLALSATVASTSSAATGGKFAEPSQPIAYSKLDSYLKATPKQRARKSWSLDQSAATGAATNASATTPQADMTTPQTGATAGDAGAAAQVGGGATDQAGPAGQTPGTTTMPAPQPDAAPTPAPAPAPATPPADNTPQPSPQP